MERAAKYCGHVFPASSPPHPAMTSLQSAPAEEQNLINTVDLLNLRSDCQGLSVIIGMFQQLKFKTFFHSTEFFKFFKNIFIGVSLLYNVVLVFTV